MYVVQHEFAVLTPDKAVVTYRLAGLSARIFAHLLDVIIVAGIMVLLSFVLAFGVGRIDPGIAEALVLIASFLVPLGYFILSEVWMNGQTLGKKATGVRVRMLDGTPITWNAACARNMLRVADILPGPYLVGMIAIFTNAKAQRLGDMLAGTVVVVERRNTPKYVIAPHRAGLHPLESQVGELEGMTLSEYHTLKRFADRFPELPDRIQHDMVVQVWLPFAELRQVPPMPTIHPIFLAEAVVMKYGRQNGLL